MKVRHLSTNRSCPEDGLLRLAVDTGVGRFPEIASHLTSCERCRERLEVLGRDATFADQKLGLLEPNDVSPNARLAYQKMHRRISVDGVANPPRGESLMSSLWNTRVARGAVAMAALVILTATFALTPMRSLADNLFNRFEVEQFQAITIKPEEFQEFGTELVLRAFSSDLEVIAGAVENLAEVETSFDMDSGFAGAREYDSAEAAAAAFGEFRSPADLPAQFDKAPRYLVSEDNWIRVTVNTASLHAILDELGYRFNSIPAADVVPELTGTIDIPTALGTYYEGENDQHLMIIQMASPVLTTPEGLDMDAARNDFLSLPGLPKEFVSQLKAVENWESTLIVPVPEGAETSDVTVDGQPGLLIEADEFDASNWGQDAHLEGEISIVMWNDNGTLYIVAGSVDGNALMDIANSLE
jgi:hypothetical protein